MKTSTWAMISIATAALLFSMVMWIASGPGADGRPIRDCLGQAQKGGLPPAQTVLWNYPKCQALTDDEMHDAVILLLDYGWDAA